MRVPTTRRRVPRWFEYTLRYLVVVPFVFAFDALISGHLLSGTLVALVAIAYVFVVNWYWSLPERDPLPNS